MKFYTHTHREATKLASELRAERGQSLPRTRPRFIARTRTLFALYRGGACARAALVDEFDCHTHWLHAKQQVSAAP